MKYWHKHKRWYCFWYLSRVSATQIYRSGSNIDHLVFCVLSNDHNNTPPSVPFIWMHNVDINESNPRAWLVSHFLFESVAINEIFLVYTQPAIWQKHPTSTHFQRLNVISVDEHRIHSEPSETRAMQSDVLNCECFLINPFNLEHLCDMMTVWGGPVCVCAKMELTVRQKLINTASLLSWLHSNSYPPDPRSH